MPIVETAFAPAQAAIGGILIGLAAVILLASNGQLMGASNIISGLLSFRLTEAVRRRAIFLLGLLVGTAWTALLVSDARDISFGAGPITTVVGGLLVGTGATLANGCTSGHGICGIARFSKRSIAATMVFMAAAIITVALLRHAVGTSLVRSLAALLSGLLFGAGVTVSGMINPMKVLNFLDLFGAFDGSLILVMAAALAVTIPGFHLIMKRQQPLFAADFAIPSMKEIDTRLLGGAALFGTGWGMTGFCPGPAIATLVLGNTLSFLFVGAMLVGMLATKILMPAKIS